MQLIFETRKLADALKLLMPITQPRGSMPALGSIKIAGFRPCGVILSANNMEQAVSMVVDCEIKNQPSTQSPGFLFPAQKLKEIVSTTKATCVEISARSANEITAETDRVTYALDVPSVRDFHEAAPVESTATIEVDSGELHQMLRQVRHAASTEKNQPSLNGVYLGFEAGTGLHHAVACDGRRLAFCGSESALSASSEDYTTAILPALVVHEICEILAQAEEPGTVSLCLSANVLEVKFNNIEMRTTLIDGDFPNWRKVIPTGNDKTITLDRAALLSRINQVRVMVEPENPSVQMHFSGQGLNLATEFSEVGNGESLLQFGGGFDLKTDCNPHYLAEALKASTSAEMEFALKDAHSPIRLQAGNLHQVIMPMRIS